MAHPKVRLDREALAAFCRKWRIQELSLFGSALRNSYRREQILNHREIIHAA